VRAFCAADRWWPSATDSGDGAWGTAIFSNDTSQDVREEFRDLIGDGFNADEATTRLVDSYRPEDPDVAADFWLGLALVQHQLGRLTERALDAALAIIESGHDPGRWTGKDQLRRAGALEKARHTLNTPQPSPRRVKPRVRVTTSLIAGQHVIFRLASGRRLLMRVTRTRSDQGGTYLTAVPLQWDDSQQVPRDAELVALTPHEDGISFRKWFGLTLFGEPGDPVDRLEVLAARADVSDGRTAEDADTSGWAIKWSEIDSIIATRGPDALRSACT